MKKIGILTFYNAHNYGAMLQAFALQKKINSNNTVKIINYRNPVIEKQYKIIRPYNKNIKKFIKGLCSDILMFPLNVKRRNSFNKFMKNNYNLSSEVRTMQEIINLTNDFDDIIVGSDQVWNIGITGSLSDFYTLNFDNTPKKISYAASVGDASQINSNKDIFKTKLTKLDYISVREEDAQLELSKIIDKPISVVLDPTLLLKKEEWNSLLSIDNTVKEKFILAYVVEADEEYIKIVNDLSEKTGLKVIHFGKRNPGYKNVLKSAYTEGPLEFVTYIKNAEYVVATSFHATVFSIIFNKKFFIVPHRKTGARVTNLLDKLGIEGRTFSSYNEFKDIDYNFETNWKEVNKKLDIEREKSINWLLNAINDEKEEKNE